MQKMSSERKTFLYYEIAEKIKDHILSENLQTGAYLPSERDLAAKFKAANITVRKSLEILSADGIIRKMPRKGSMIARIPEREADRFQKKRIGLTIWMEAGINHPCTLNVLNVMGNEFPPDKYEVVIIYVTNEMLKSQDWNGLLKNGLDGLFVSVQEIPEKVLRQIQSSGIPSVFAGFEGMKPGVWCDEESGVSKILNYLSSLGHKRIGFVTPPGMPITENQIKAFRSFHGLKLPDKYIVYGSFDEKSGYQKTMELLEMKKAPTAILFGDDFMAMGALKAISNKRLKCPCDISIACFGGTMISEQMHPSITNIKSSGVFPEAAKMLRQLVENKNDSSDTIILERELIVRESTASKKH